MKKLFKWLGNGVLVIILICAVLSVFSFIKAKKNPNTVPSIGPYKFMSVLSGSMSPIFNPYDMIVDKTIETENIKKGDVITFRVDNKTLVTHRIIDIQSENGKMVYKTRGDANNVDDEKLVDVSKIEGAYLFRIPYGGLIMEKLKGPIGIGIVWLLLMFVIYNEFLGKKKSKSSIAESHELDKKEIKETLNR
jgi:signal peptidase